jgi:zinc-ribbon domain
MPCRECGTENPPGSMYCSKCGEALSVPAAQSAGAQFASPAAVSAGPAAQKAEAQPLVSNSPLAGMGDRATATVLDSIAIAAIFPLA